MYMSKITIISIVLIILGTLVAGFFILSGDDNQGGQEPVVTNPPGTGTPVVTEPVPTSEEIKLVGAGGGSIGVRNFLKDTTTVTDPSNEGYYFLGNHYPFDGSTPTELPHYIISYIADTQYFNVVLTSEPVGTSRLEAEQYLMQALDITPVQMCALNYMVSVPGYVNETLSDISLGFSFCKGSTPL